MLIVDAKTNEVIAKEITIQGANPVYEKKSYSSKKNDIYAYMHKEPEIPLEYFKNMITEDKNVDEMSRKQTFSNLQKNVGLNSGKQIWFYINNR